LVRESKREQTPQEKGGIKRAKLIPSLRGRLTETVIAPRDGTVNRLGKRAGTGEERET